MRNKQKMIIILFIIINNNNMSEVSLWKYNTANANGHACEDGIGDGGLVIFASTRQEALGKLYDRFKTDGYAYLPECDYDEDDNEIPILWDEFTEEEFIAKLTEMLDDKEELLFLIPFPTEQIIL